jgi:hypothetical protein
MSEIVGSVQRVTDIIGEITAAASEQSDGIGLINSSVVQLDSMTQQNASLVEESAAAAESLKMQAASLSQVVSVSASAPDRRRPCPARTPNSGRQAERWREIVRGRRRLRACGVDRCEMALRRGQVPEARDEEKRQHRGHAPAGSANRAPPVQG